MKSLFLPMLLLSLIATAQAIWSVGFSRRWKDEAKQFLRNRFGQGPNDEDIAEEARQDATKMWLAIAAVAWFITAMAYRL